MKRLFWTGFAASILSAISLYAADGDLPAADTSEKSDVRGVGVEVKNSSFDDIVDGRPAGWDIKGERIRAEAGAGCNGSPGVVWERPEPLFSAAATSVSYSVSDDLACVSSYRVKERLC